MTVLTHDNSKLVYTLQDNATIELKKSEPVTLAAIQDMGILYRNGWEVFSTIESDKLSDDEKWCRFLLRVGFQDDNPVFSSVLLDALLDILEKRNI